MSEQKKMYTYNFPMAAVTVDAGIVSKCNLMSEEDQKYQILLIKRGGEPYKGCWALPGGFLNVGKEDCLTAFRRELKEETNVDLESGDDSVKLVGVFSRPDRDPRGHTVTVAYMAVVDSEAVSIKAGDDAAEAKWFSFDELSSADLAFDHAEIISCIQRML